MNFNHSHKPAKVVFMDEDEIKLALGQMESDPALKTDPVIVQDTPTPNQLVSFGEKHASYLKEHPKVNPKHYLSNLRAMVKIRASR